MSFLKSNNPIGDYKADFRFGFIQPSVTIDTGPHQTNTGLAKPKSVVIPVVQIIFHLNLIKATLRSLLLHYSSSLETTVMDWYYQMTQTV